MPPGQSKLVTGLILSESRYNSASWDWEPADLYLYCTSEQCDGYRFFEATSELSLNKKHVDQLFLSYTCRNCRRKAKQYAVSIKMLSKDQAEISKYGEVPTFGGPTPSKVLSLMGGERQNFLKGRQCENQGLGIAAFAYYRRVVESQKAKIIGEILKVAEKLNADPALIDELRAAKEETRFTEAINRVKHGLPQVLLINGHNPLTLLHSALSEGLHATSDEECLELATSIRIVLTELVERMATAVKEEAALASAVNRLLQVGGKRKD